MPRPWVVTALAVCCLGLVGGLLWSKSGHGSAPTAGRAGSPAAPITSPSGPSAQTQDPATQSASPAPAGPCQSPAACGFPTAASTGPGATRLTAHSGNLEIRRDGEVVDGWDLTGSLDVYANDVTIVDSRIDSADWWAVNLRPGHTGLRILHSLLTGTPGAGPDNGGEDYAVSDMGAGSIEVGWDDVSVFADALSMGNGYIHDDYVHDLVPFIDRAGIYAHMDAVISDGDDRLGLLIRHNTLINSAPLNHGPTSAVGLLPNTGPIADTSVEDNWLAGGSYALYAGGARASDVVVIGNVFSTQITKYSGYYGVVADWNAEGKGNVWSDNRYSDGAVIGIGDISKGG